MKPPSGDPSEFCLAHRAESGLFMPGIAKSGSTPKRIQHMSAFSIFEVGFIRGIVRVGFAFDLDVSGQSTSVTCSSICFELPFTNQGSHCESFTLRI
jgi:hypothetical protein